MQYFRFQDFLISILFFLGTCQTGEPVTMTTHEHGSTLQLAEPNDETQNDHKDISTKLTLILIDSEKLYAYEGKDINSGSYQNYGEIRKLVQNSKKKFPKKEFVVIIKTTPKTTYKETVDVLDEMTINDIERYSISNLFPHEKEKLRLN